MADTGSIALQIVDGARQPFERDVLVQIVDGNKEVLVRDTFKGPMMIFRNLPIFDNSGDLDTIVASAAGFGQDGFFPVKVARNVLRTDEIAAMYPDSYSTFAALRSAWDPDGVFANTLIHQLFGD